MKTITAEQKEKLIALNELIAKEEQKAIEKYNMLEKEAKQLMKQKQITDYELNLKMYGFTSDEALKKSKGSKKDDSQIFRISNLQIAIKGWKKFVLNGDKQNWLQVSALGNYQVCNTFYLLFSEKISKLSIEELLLIDNIKIEATIAYQWNVGMIKTSVMETKTPNWYYSNIDRQLLYMHFDEEAEFCEALSYLLTFQKHTGLKVTPHPFSVEISNENIHIFVIHTVFFQQKEYKKAKQLKNVHFVAFCQEIAKMHEFSEMKDEIKFISKQMLMATVEALTDNKLITAIQGFKKLNI